MRLEITQIRKVGPTPSNPRNTVPTPERLLPTRDRIMKIAMYQFQHRLALATSHFAFFILHFSICTLLGSSSDAQDDFFITLRDGTLLRSKLNDSPLTFQRVGPKGSVSSDQLQFNAVQRIEFALTPSSRQLADIRRLLADLESPDYHVRNEAEAEITKDGRQFIEVITAAQETDNPEVRYRVIRILKQLKGKNAKRIDAEFDVVTLDGGETISGELLIEKIQVDFRGRSLAVPRESIATIAQAPNNTPGALTGPTATQVFSKPGETFYQTRDVYIDFQFGRRNESFDSKEDIRNSFVHRGVRFSASDANAPILVVASTFKLNQTRSKQFTVGTDKKYKGSIQIDFCEPGLANVPATVQRVGCYMGIVDHPRDFVMDAYSADNRIVATADALESNSFLGIESTIPIAYVRIHQNPNLIMNSAAQDDNYVIDDLTFDPPRAAPAAAMTEEATLRTVDGSRIICSGIEFDGQDFVARSLTPLETDGTNPILSFAPNEVAAITFWLSSPPAQAEGLSGYFADGSFLPLTVDGEKFSSRDFDQWTFDRSALAGVCGSHTILRYPLSEDLASKQSVVVRPAERWLVPEIQIDSDGASWDQSAAQLREAFKREEHAPDTTSQFALSDAPSIWWQSPSEPDANLGWLRTVDGRTFALNGSSQIQIEKLERDAVILSRATQQIRIPWSEIAALKFPK